MAIGTFLVDKGSTGDTSVRIGGRLLGERIFVPIVSNDPDALKNRVQVATSIASATGGVCSVGLPEASSETGHRTIAPREDPDMLNDVLAWAHEQALDAKDHWSGGVFDTRALERTIRNRVVMDSWDTLVLPPTNGGGFVANMHQRRLYEDPPCGVLTVNCTATFKDYASILLPIANGPNSGLATDVASVLAYQCDAYVDILHVIDPDSDEEIYEAAEKRVATAEERIAQPDRTSTWLLESRDPAAEIIEQSAYYGLTVIGAPQSSRLHRFVYGSVSDSISAEADSAVVSVSAETQP